MRSTTGGATTADTGAEDRKEPEEATNVEVVCLSR